jgi:hypothetical protein
VQLSVKYETVLNMTTAKALGLDVPTSILLSADERNTATQEDWIADGGNGSKPVSLEVSKCFPVCPRKRTSDLRVNEYLM